MDDSAADRRSALLTSLDLSSVDDVLARTDAILPGLATLAAAVLLRRSLAKLMRARSSGTPGAPAVAAALQQNGVAVALGQIAESPERMAGLVRLAALGQLGAAGRPAVLGVAVRSPRALSDRALQTLSPLAARIQGQQAQFARLAQFSGAAGVLLPVARRPQLGGRGPALVRGFPAMTPLTAAHAWPAWSTALAALGGAAGGLRSVGIDPTRGDVARHLANRLDSLRPPMTSAPAGWASDIPLLGSLVAALTSIDLLRRHLAIDLLRPGWQAGLTRAAAEAARLHGSMATGAPAPQAQIVDQLTAMRTTLVNVNQFGNTFGFPLHTADAGRRLQDTMRSLQQAAADPVVGSVTAASSAGDASLIRRLLQELARLYGSVMAPALSPARAGVRRTG